MALEPGETLAIVNAVQTAYTPVIDEMDQRLRAVELRVANVEARVKGGVQLGKGGQMEPATATEAIISADTSVMMPDHGHAQINEGLVTHGAQIQQLAGVYEQMRVMVEQHGVAILRLMLGGEAEGWREFVVGEMMRLGVGVGEYANAVRAQKQADGQDELPLEGV